MGLRELLESVRQLASAHRVAVITSFLIVLVAIYALAPIEWQVFFLDKTPSFFPFEVTLFDVLVIAASLAVGLACHGLISLCSLLKKKISKLSPKKIKRIFTHELNDIDRYVLICMVYDYYLDNNHPEVMTSKDKLKEKKLIGPGYMGVFLVRDSVKSFVYQQVEVGNINLKEIFPDKYRSYY